MNVLTVIPARGGSKGLPRKNVLALRGRPLLAWSIDAAKEAESCVHRPAGEVRTVVSTEDAEIADLARANGAEVVERPDELATDVAKTDDVLVHAVKTLAAGGWDADIVVTLQPTVPVRAAGIVGACMCRLLNTNADSLITAYPLHFVWWNETPAYVYDGATGRMLPPAWRTQCPRRPMRQQMEGRDLMYSEDGSVYVTRAAFLLRTGTRVGGHVEVYVTERTIDIDTVEDFAIAEALMSFRNHR